jgi:hypothetical protein
MLPSFALSFVNEHYHHHYHESKEIFLSIIYMINGEFSS